MNKESGESKRTDKKSDDNFGSSPSKHSTTCKIVSLVVSTIHSIANLPQLIAIRMAVSEPPRMIVPAQSKYPSPIKAGVNLLGRPRVMKLVIMAIPQNGRLIQKIHCHLSSANAPPIMGPRIVPTPQLIEMIPNHLPRFLSETRSVMNAYVIARQPPEPRPCTDRPASSRRALGAIPPSTLPIASKVMLAIVMAFRPNI